MGNAAFLPDVVVVRGLASFVLTRSCTASVVGFVRFASDSVAGFRTRRSPSSIFRTMPDAPSRPDRGEGMHLFVPRLLCGERVFPSVLSLAGRCLGLPFYSLRSLFDDTLTHTDSERTKVCLYVLVDGFLFGILLAPGSDE